MGFVLHPKQQHVFHFLDKLKGKVEKVEEQVRSKEISHMDRYMSILPCGNAPNFSCFLSEAVFDPLNSTKNLMLDEIFVPLIFL